MNERLKVCEKNDIKEITLTLSASAKTMFTNGNITVGIQARRGAPVTVVRYSCYIYSEDYYPMCNSEFAGECTRQGSNYFTIEMPCHHTWLPGHYLLFIKDKKEITLERISFSLDQSLKPTLGQPEEVSQGSLDDILITCVENKDAAWDVLSTTPGMKELCKYGIKSIQLRVYNDMRKAMNGKEQKCSENLLIYTTNKDLDEQKLGKFQKLAVVGAYFTYINSAKLYNAALANPFETLNEVMSNTTSQVYCLTNIGALLNTGGKVIVKRIIEKISDASGIFRLWLVGTHREIDNLFEVYPALSELFLRDNHVSQLPYTAFELVQAFMTELSNKDLNPTYEVMDTLSRRILKLHQQGCFATWSLSHINRFVAEDVLPNYLSRTLRDLPNLEDGLPSMTLADINMNRLPQSTSSFDDSITELNRMIGLDDIKQSIVTMANQTRFLMERQWAGYKTTCNATHHAIFTGNPGTGKTTVAKMLGRIYHAVGILSKGEVICADRTRLIGRFIGETEENMKTVLEEARGNILFIDEAYTLYEGAADKKDFGSKVIDSLLTVLAQPNPDMVIIFAGYEKEMDAMLNSNPGLMGRFPYKYRFSDYTECQLMEIACQLLSRDEYILTDEAKALLSECISDTVSRRSKNFSNARWIEQFVRNGIIPAMANRIVTSGSKEYQRILSDDVRNGYQKFNPSKTELRARQKVGFSV